MQIPSFSKTESSALLALAIFGFVVPNGVFVWYFLRDPGLLRAALANPLAVTFMAEALILTGLFAWLVARLGLRRPSPLGFVVLSLVGSLAFSVPATLRLAAKESARNRGES